MAITMKAARINAGLTQADAAKALNIHRNTLSKYENYETSPDMQMAEAMARLYGRPVNDIIFCK